MDSKLEKREVPTHDLPRLTRDSDDLVDANIKRLERASEEEIQSRKILRISGVKPPVQNDATEESKPKSNFTFHFEKPADSKPLFTFKQTDQSKDIMKDQAEGAKAQNADSKPSEPKSFFNDSNFGKNFGNLFSNTDKTSLLGGENKPVPTTAANTPGTGFFGNASATGLFNNTNTTGSIFSHLANIGAKKQAENSDDGSDGDDADDEKKEDTDEEEVKKKATVHTTYNSPYEPIISKPAFNFRVERDDSIGAGFVSIERLKEMSDAKTEAGENKDEAKEGEQPNTEATSAPSTKQSAYPVLVFRNKTKNILHTSFLIPKVSSFAFVKNRNDALAITVLFTPNKKDENDKPKPTKTFVKILFNTEDDAKEFKAQLDKLL
jgi:hypothetical protein